MRILIFDVDQAPEPADLSVQANNAYPQLLLDEMQLWRRQPLSSLAELLQQAEQYQPALIVFVGAASQAWSRQAEALLPRLFVFAHPRAETESIVDGIHERTWQLRRRRLAGREPRLPELAGGTDPEQLFAALPGNLRRQARERALALITRYGLTGLYPLLDTEAFERGLSCLALLETHLPAVRPERALDIGCHLWSYAPFLRAFVNGPDSESGETVPSLTGVELDPWYLQADGLTREDWARYHAGLARAEYLEGDPSELALPQQDLITLLLPIVLPENALRWGLPQARFDPNGLLSFARSRLRPGGRVLIYNGVEREYDATLALLHGLGWAPRSQGPHHCPLRQSDQGFAILLEA